MCTAITYLSKDHYFGRNLDYEHPYPAAVTITPRNFSFQLRNGNTLKTRYAMIGMAAVVDNYPLYFDATNEKGLSIAGLNFPGNAVYNEPVSGKKNITPFELIPWLLGTCKDIIEAEAALKNLNLTNENFSSSLPLTPLHWMVSDKDRSIVIESTKEGLEIFDDPIGVLTNNPPFEYHMHNINNYINVTSAEPDNRFSSKFDLIPYSRGMGGIGLPGDLSSASRFIRVAFTKLNSVSSPDEADSVAQFFHILGSVSQTRGCAVVNDSYEMTLYTSCCNTDTCVYYYTTYENSALTAVKLFSQDLDNSELSVFPLNMSQHVRYEN